VGQANHNESDCITATWMSSEEEYSEHRTSCLGLFRRGFEKREEKIPLPLMCRVAQILTGTVLVRVQVQTREDPKSVCAKQGSN
jgi:hypothetical protein